MGKNTYNNKKTYGTKKKESSKAVKAGIAIMLIIMIGLAVAGGFGWSYALQYKSKIEMMQEEGQKEPEKVLIAFSDLGEPLYSFTTYEMPRSITYIADESVYLPEQSIIIEAQTADGLINGHFEWSISYQNPNSVWAHSHNAPEDYLMITPKGYSKLEVKCLERFGEPILVTAQLEDGTKTASCTFDCLKLASYQFDTWGIGASDVDDDFDVNILVNYGTGTVEGQHVLTSAVFRIEPEFISTVKSYLKFDITFKSYKYSEEEREATMYVNGNKDIAFFTEGKKASYSMFIEGFENFDEAHQNAIIYAWYRAFKNNYQIGYTNVLVDYTVLYKYNGVYVLASGGSETDIPAGILSGSSHGVEIEPDILLNGNYVM